MSKELKLKHPVIVDGREYKTLHLRRMKAKDAFLAEDETNKIKAGYLLFAALANVDLAVIEELDMEDIAKLGEVMKTLMGKLPREVEKKLENQLGGAT